MLTRVLIVCFTFFTFQCLGQKEYVFNHLLEYERTFFGDSVRQEQKVYYLTNAKNSDYIAIITEKDSANFLLDFRDRKGGYAKFSIAKIDFIKAEFIRIACNRVKPYSSSYGYKIRNYDFQILSDTLIEDELYGHYKLKSSSPRREKRKKLGEQHYLIDKKTTFHLPILEFSTSYYEWEVNRNIPSGIVVWKYLKGNNNEVWKQEKLIQFAKLDKKIIIPQECIYNTD